MKSIQQPSSEINIRITKLTFPNTKTRRNDTQFVFPIVCILFRAMAFVPIFAGGASQEPDKELECVDPGIRDMQQKLTDRSIRRNDGRYIPLGEDERSWYLWSIRNADGSFCTTCKISYKGVVDVFIAVETEADDTTVIIAEVGLTTLFPISAHLKVCRELEELFVWLHRVMHETDIAIREEERMDDRAFKEESSDTFDAFIGDMS
uniref:Uncharacterized protein n=1 Tax=viral metagenome TaxID=1070528 RepID=A0A6C0IW83_9ZZZZ